MLGIAMAGREFRAIANSRSSYLDLWPGGSAEEQSFARSRAVTSFACRSHADMEEHDLFLPTRRLGIRVLQVQGETT